MITSFGRKEQLPRHCWQYFHSMTWGRQCKFEMVQVILHQTVSLVRAVMLRIGAIIYVYVYCQNSKENSSRSSSVYSAIIFVCRTNEWRVYACSILFILGLQAATVVQTSVEGRLNFNDSVDSGLHLHATNRK